jgi:hypothetical protein
MKQRLKAIIDACSDQNADSAPILKMLRNMHDEWKDPERVVECGYVDPDGIPDNDYMQQFQGMALAMITAKTTTFKGGDKDLKVTFILEKSDDE